MAHLHLLWSSSHYGSVLILYKPIHKVELSGATKLPNPYHYQKLVGILQFTYVLVHLICMTMVIKYKIHVFLFFFSSL